MTIYNLPAFIESMRAAFPEYNFDFHWQGNDTKTLRPWARVFVGYHDPAVGIPVQIGRVNFQPKMGLGWKIYGHKHYKPSDMPYDPEDAFFYQFDTWARTGVCINIEGLERIAMVERARKIKEMEAKRAENPKKRKRLNLNWMGEFRRLVEAKINEAEESIE